jgi:uncharacterized glyoxalase superfamily protein PhnB
MTVSIAHVTVDCTDAATLAGFWSDLVKHPVDEGASEFFATVGLQDQAFRPALMFLKVPEPKATKNRVHLDLHAEDWEAEVQRAVGLGATHVADFDEYGTRWATLLDPEGNEFDIGAGM